MQGYIKWVEKLIGSSKDARTTLYTCSAVCYRSDEGTNRIFPNTLVDLVNDNTKEGLYCNDNAQTSHLRSSTSELRARGCLAESIPTFMR